MFNEAPLHTALRALVLEHLLLPARESVQNARAGQDSLLPWLTKTALAEPIKNCNAVFKVSTNEEDKDALAAHKAACDVVWHPSLPLLQGELEDLQKKLKKCNDAKKSLQDLLWEAPRRPSARGCVGALSKHQLHLRVLLECRRGPIQSFWAFLHTMVHLEMTRFV